MTERAIDAAAPAPAPPTDAGTAPGPAPWFGREDDHRHAAVAGIGSLLACVAYALIARTWAPDVAPGPVEFAATATSLWSVWITQRRNVLALPVGIVSVVLLGWFFRDIGLIGQTWLQWGYYLPVQLWAWWQWTRGGEARSALTVTRLTWPARATVLAAVVTATVLVGLILDAGWQDALHAWWDASIVAASVVAMILLARKKVESWWLWIGPVNVSAIGLYVLSGAYMFAALYGLFLVMAFVGLARWRRAARDGVA